MDRIASVTVGMGNYPGCQQTHDVLGNFNISDSCRISYPDQNGTNIGASWYSSDSQVYNAKGNTNKIYYFNQARTNGSWHAPGIFEFYVASDGTMVQRYTAES
jgi:hypothetical protein